MLFDADKLSRNDKSIEISVRQATDGETMVTLSDEEVKLTSEDTLIVDNVSGRLLVLQVSREERRRR